MNLLKLTSVEQVKKFKNVVCLVWVYRLQNSATFRRMASQKQKLQSYWDVDGRARDSSGSDQWGTDENFTKVGDCVCWIYFACDFICVGRTKSELVWNITKNYEKKIELWKNNEKNKKKLFMHVLADKSGLYLRYFRVQ